MKKGRRIVSIAVILTMLLSMCTFVSAADEVPEQVLYRRFLTQNGGVGDGNGPYDIGTQAYVLGKMMTSGSNVKFEAENVYGTELPDKNDGKGLKFSITKDKYGTEELMLNAVTKDTPSQQPLPMFAWDNARVEFDVWSTAQNPENYPTGMGMFVTGKDVAKAWPRVNAKNDWKPNTWNHCSILLSDLLTAAGVNKNSTDVLAYTYRIFMPAGVTEDFDIYFRNFRVVYTPSINVDAAVSTSAKKVTLTYEPYGGIVADSYDIYRDDKLIAENITETTYTDADITPNNEYTYTVTAKLNGNAVATVKRTITPTRSSKDCITYIGRGYTDALLTGHNGYDMGSNTNLGIRNDGGANVFDDTTKKESMRISAPTDWAQLGNIAGFTLTDEELKKYGEDKAVYIVIPEGQLKENATMRVEINRLKNKTYTDEFLKLPTEYWDSAYLTFEVWDTEGKNCPTDVKMPISAKESDNGEEIYREVTVPITTQYKARTWNHVEIPLSSFMNRHSYAKIANCFYIYFGGHNGDNAESKMFIRGLKICYAPGVNVTASAVKNDVTLTIAPYDMTAESFNIYRDGELIAANVNGTTYTDTVDKTGCSYSYTVAAVSDGDEVAEGKTDVVVYPLNRDDADVVSLLGSDGSSQFNEIKFTTGTTPTLCDFAPQTDGTSQKWYYNKNDTALTGKEELAQQYLFDDDGFTLAADQNIEFMLYTDAETKDKLPSGLAVFYADDKENSYRVADLKDRIELNKWNYIKIPASKLGVTGDYTYGRILDRIELVSDKLAGAEKSFNVYIANMGLSYETLTLNAALADGKVMLSGTPYDDYASFKLYKEGTQAPLLETTDENELFFEDIVTEYNVTNKYILNSYDKNGKLMSSAECNIKIDAPADGAILTLVDGALVDECKAGDTVTVKAYPKGNAETFVVIAATYSADGKLLKAETVTGGSFVPAEGGAKVKLMVLDGMTSITPLTNAKTLNIN